MPTQICPDEIEWKLTGYIQMDPLGRVFVWNEGIYRAIFPEQTDYVNWLFNEGVAASLIEKGLLVDTWIRPDLALDGFGLILEHKRIPFPTKAATWTFPMFKQAALLFLDLNTELLKYGLCTVDGHQENTFITDNCRPIWIDFGSIMPLNEGRNLCGLRQFVNCYLNILLLQQEKPALSDLLRVILHKKGSISPEEYEALTGRKYEFPFHNRKKCLDLLRGVVSKIQTGHCDSKWQTYHRADEYLLDFETSPDTRYKLINDILCRLKPKSVVDIACNAGKFSVLAAYHGADVYAFDIDEPALNKFYHKLMEIGPQFSVCLASHSIFGWQNGNRFDYMQEINPTVKGDFVLALAITHHLSLTQSIPFADIARKLASYSKHALGVEFMPYGLNNTKPTPHPIPDWYTLNNFLTAFEPYFEHASIVFYPVQATWSFRIFILFEGLKEPGSSSPMRRNRYYYALERLKGGDMVLRTVCPECGDRGLFHEAKSLVCHKCGQPLRGVPLPLKPGGGGAPSRGWVRP